MKRPTRRQRFLLHRAGKPIPHTRAEAAEAVVGVLDDDAATRGFVSRKSEEVHTLRLVIDEQARQLAELRRLVKMQRIHIARLRAGDDID